MNLNNALVGQVYSISSINTGDDEVNSFLLTLGCYSGEEITVVKHGHGICVVSIKEGRYSFDKKLASLITIQEKLAA